MAGFWGSPKDWTLALAIVFGFSGFAVSIYTSKPEWSVPFLTAVLIIVTYWYASSSQRLVESYEKDRKRHVIQYMGQTISFPLRLHLNEWKRKVEDGAFLADLIMDLKGGKEGQITLFPAIINPLHSLPHKPDRTLKGYLEEMEKSFSDLDEAVSGFREFLVPIARKRLDMGVDFDDFIKGLKSHFPVNSPDTQFGFTIAGPETIPSNYGGDFYMEKRNDLKAFFIGRTFQADMKNYQRERKFILTAIKNLETILERLLKDWGEEYDLTPVDFSLSPTQPNPYSYYRI